jgi:putative iron-regulated protein
MNMKSIIIIATVSVALIITACRKKKEDTIIPVTIGTTAETLPQNVIVAFADNIALPQYNNISTGGTDLVNAVNTLSTAPTQTNLLAAQQQWRNLRATWELSEAFLFGPVADQNLDPNVDDWPVNKADFDSVLVSNSSLNDSVVANYQTSLKGFHALEYILFGPNQSRKATTLTTREKQYMIAVANDLKTNCTKMYEGWSTNNGNYYTTFTTTNSVYNNKQTALLSLVNSMAGICGEVGVEKIESVYLAQDAALEESQFSQNSFTDFKNNIIGVRNVYMNTYNGNDGMGFEDITRKYNLSLDAKIKQQLETAINSFNAYNKPFGEAIFTETTQLLNTINALKALSATLDTELKPMIIANIK